jgi:putative transposase
MSHTHSSVRVHCIFSTKERRKIIPANMQPRLWGYIGATATKLGMKTFAVGGIEDHAHALIALPPTMMLSEAMQKIKANSSRWMGEQGIEFAWQEGYGAFSVSISRMDETIAYIQNQREHHKKKSFEEEWAEILKRHGMAE